MTVVSNRVLNRTLLARQHLLERSPLSVPQMCEYLVGLQAQDVPPPFVGLWNRIADFDKRRPAATESDLRNALDAVLAAKPVPRPKTDVIGCAINLVNPEKKP